MIKTRTQKNLTIGRRIILTLLFLGGIMVGALELVEESKEPLRFGLQDYLSKVSGHRAEITTLEKSELFPEIEFLMKGIVVRNKDKSEKTMISADSAHIDMGFWKTFFGMRDYRVIEFRNVAFATGYLLPKKLELSFAGISESFNGTPFPFFIFDGVYNSRPLLITAQMERTGKKKFSYNFNNEFPVTFKLGEIEANAIFKRGLTSVEFAQMTISSGKEEALLSARDITYKPLNIALNGKIAGVPIDGSLVKVDQIYKLSIHPHQDDKDSLAKISRFMTDVKKEFAIDDDTKNIVIEITPADVAKKDSTENKEVAPE